jgi:prevent-host-death family protein
MKNSKVNYTASDARSNFYTLLRDASMGVATYEITNKYGEAAVLLSKDEYESWNETLDITARPEELKAIKTAQKEQKTLTHQQLLKELDMEQE